MTESKETRALNAFAAMSRIPDDYVLAAEQMLQEAEAGISRPQKPEGRFRRFLNSGWGAAMISGIVALAVLVFIIRAGKEPPTYDPPKQPAGSTIEMSAEGVNYTLSTELENYPEGTERITAVMTGKTKGETVYQAAGWHLERLTSDGAEPVGSFHTDDYVWHEPDADQYARTTKLIYIEEPLSPGTYRLHATKYDGEKYVSVAWCEFTVGETEGETRPVLDYPPAEEQPYTIYVPDVSYSNGCIPVTVTAKEKGQSLEASFRNWKIVKLMGTSDPYQADWYYSAEEVGAVLPSEENHGYAVYREELTVYAWNKGVYRIYALNERGEYVDYCDFAFFADNPLPFELYWVSNGRVPNSRDTHLEVLFQSKYRGQTVDCEIQWSIYRIESDLKTLTLIGTSESSRLYIPSTDPDEFVTKSVLLSIEQATGGSAVTLPSYDVLYELVLHYETDSGEIYDYPISFAVHDDE